MQTAIDLAVKGVSQGAGGPFGAVVVAPDGKIMGKGYNTVISANDPTAHAEVNAIRDACQQLGNFRLSGCRIVTSCEPCPMCLSAIYWSRISSIFYACTRKDAASIGFDDAMIYEEMNMHMNQRSIPSEQVMRDKGLKAFELWLDKSDKVKY